MRPEPTPAAVITAVAASKAAEQPPAVQPLPVTLLSGFLGAGKTSLLQHLLQSPHGLKIAVIVNDMSEVNIDAATVARDIQLSRTDARLVEMSNGCICCTLREDLLEEISRLALARQFDYLLIESSGISEPLPVAETFTFTAADGSRLADIARLDTLVTVVDAVNFLQDYLAADALASQGPAADEEDDRTIADLLIEQIEFANVLVLSKTDLISASELAKLQQILRQLNPAARQEIAIKGRLDPATLLNTGLFDEATAAAHQQWLAEAPGEHIPESESYGISSFAFSARRPFHPERFYQFLHQDWPHGRLLRSKGFFWLANVEPAQQNMAWQWHQAGGIARYHPAGYFWFGLSEAEWPTDDDARAAILAQWQQPFGDCRQDLVFIGQQLDETAMRAQLSACLVSDAELADLSQLRCPFSTGLAAATVN